MSKINNAVVVLKDILTEEHYVELLESVDFKNVLIKNLRGRVYESECNVGEAKLCVEYMESKLVDLVRNLEANQFNDPSPGCMSMALSNVQHYSSESFRIMRLFDMKLGKIYELFKNSMHTTSAFEPVGSSGYINVANDNVSISELPLDTQAEQRLEEGMASSSICSSRETSMNQTPRRSTRIREAKRRKKMFRCKKCRIEFEFENMREAHVKFYHNSQGDNFRFGCSKCDFQTDTMSQLMIHRNRVHYKKEMTPQPDGDVTNDESTPILEDGRQPLRKTLVFCDRHNPRRFFRTREHLEKHINRHHKTTTKVTGQ